MQANRSGIGQRKPHRFGCNARVRPAHQKLDPLAPDLPACFVAGIGKADGADQFGDLGLRGLKVFLPKIGR